MRSDTKQKQQCEVKAVFQESFSIQTFVSISISKNQDLFPTVFPCKCNTKLSRPFIHARALGGYTTVAHIHKRIMERGVREKYCSLRRSLQKVKSKEKERKKERDKTKGKAYCPKPK